MENLLPTHYYVFILLVIFGVFVWPLLFNEHDKKKKKLVGRVTQLRTYPVKSAKSFPTDKVDVTHLGLKHDRQFVLLNQYGTFTTLRKYPKFVLICTEILKDQIRLSADGMPDLYLPLHMKKKDGDHTVDVTVWTITTEGVHVSEEADEWFARFLNLEGCKLYCYPVDGLPRRTRDKGQYEVFENYDNTPNTDNFGRIQIGSETILEGVYPSERCVAINVDPKKGVMSQHSVLQFLNETRSGAKASLYSHKLKGGLFGFNYGVRQIGQIKVGDPVYQLC